MRAHEPPAHLLIAFPLLEGVAGAVPVLEEGQGAVQEVVLYIVLDDGFLVFDGDVLLVQFIVHGDAGVAAMSNVSVMFIHL